MDSKMTRRKALITAGLAPTLAMASPALVGLGAARAAAPLQGPSQRLSHRFKLGGFEVTSLLAGTRTTPDPQGTFGTNVSKEDFAAVSQANFIPADKTQNFFTPVLVNTGTELVLFDTGLAPEGILAALAEAGVAPEAIDVVVLTHMHGDHIGGLSGASGPTFASARYVTGAIEFDHWSKAGNEGFDKHVKPLAEKTTMLDDGAAAVSGITAHLAAGHTPGHMVYSVESEGQRLMLTADTANHYVWSLAHPDWEVRFDADKAAAAATRRRVFGEIAAERIPFIGYHMPYPAMGYVATEGDGFRYVPVSYQMLLE